MISDFKTPNNSFHAAEFLRIVGLTVISILIQNKSSTFLPSAVFIVA